MIFVILGTSACSFPIILFFIYPDIHLSIQSCNCLSTPSATQLSIYSSIHQPQYPPTYPSIQLPINSLRHSFSCSLTHLPTNSLTYLFSTHLSDHGLTFPSIHSPTIHPYTHSSSYTSISSSTLSLSHPYVYIHHPLTHPSNTET